MAKPDIDRLTMQSCPSQVVSHLVQQHFGTKEVERFLRKQNVADESSQSLAEFLTSPRVRERVERQWVYETDPKWKDRTVAEALRETTLHAIVSLSGDAQLYLYWDNRDRLPGVSSEEAKQIERQTNLLYRFFNQKLR